MPILLCACGSAGEAGVWVPMPKPGTAAACEGLAYSGHESESEPSDRSMQSSSVEVQLMRMSR